MTEHAELVARLPPVMTSLGGVPYNREHIDHWKARALAAEAKLAQVERERDEARAKLFPYAEDREISGMSWNGFYLIGNDKSIKELRRIENRSAQLEVFTKAYEERIAALMSGRSSLIATKREQLAALTARATAAEAKVAKLEEAARHIRPYLVWTISDESPGHHPTMPSAVSAFIEACGADTFAPANRALNTIEGGGR